LGSRIQLDGSDMRASQPAHRRLLGRAFHVLASAWAVGPVQDTPVVSELSYALMGRLVLWAARGSLPASHQLPAVGPSSTALIPCGR